MVFYQSRTNSLMLEMDLYEQLIKGAATLILSTSLTIILEYCVIKPKFCIV